jgi:hypothetical protein
MMNDVSSVPIGDCENTLSFPSEETSLGSGLPSHLSQRDVPCPHGALHTVFSTTQLRVLIFVLPDTISEGRVRSSHIFL